MPLETATYLSQLVTSNPAHTDAVSADDSHVRLIKAALLATFPAFTAAPLASTQAALDAAATSVGSGVFKAAVGLPATPSYSYTADTNTGWYSFGSDDQRATCNGADVLSVRPAGVDVLGGATKLLLAGTAAFPLATANLGDAQVTTAKLVANSVTYPKLQAVTQAALLGATAAGAVAEIPLGAGLSFSGGNLAAAVVLPRSYLAGLAISNNVSAPNTDLDISAGSCRDSTNTGNIDVAAITKRLSSVWAVGSGQGGLDTGAVGNGCYHVFAIKRVDTGVTDVLFSLSATAPQMPTNYTLFRRIGSRLRVAGAIQQVIQTGDLVELVVPVLDESSTSITTTATTITLESVPTGIVVSAIFNAIGGFGTTGANAFWISPLDVTHATPTTGTAAAPGGSYFSALSISGAPIPAVGGRGECRTNTSGQMRAASSFAMLLGITTIGWRDRRGKDD